MRAPSGDGHVLIAAEHLVNGGSIQASGAVLIVTERPVDVGTVQAPGGVFVALVPPSEARPADEAR